MKIKNLLLFCTSVLFLCCSNDDSSENNVTEEAMYFPPIGSTTWETKTPESLNWNTANIQIS